MYGVKMKDEQLLIGFIVFIICPMLIFAILSIGKDMERSKVCSTHGIYIDGHCFNKEALNEY